MLKLFKIWALRASLRWLPCPLDKSPYSLSTSLLSGQDVPILILFFLCCSHFSKKSSFLLVRMACRSHGLALGVLLLIEVLPLPGLLVDRTRKYVHVYIHLHVYLFIYLYIDNHAFILTAIISIQYHRVHFSLFHINNSFP